MSISMFHELLIVDGGYFHCLLAYVNITRIIFHFPQIPPAIVIQNHIVYPLCFLYICFLSHLRNICFSVPVGL